MKQINRNHQLSTIPCGAGNAVGMKYLSSMWGVSDRETRRIIMKLRIDGAIIIGDANGYYRPTCQAEIRSYYRLVVARQKSTAMAVAAVRRELKKQDDSDFQQLSLFPEG